LALASEVPFFVARKSFPASTSAVSQVVEKHIRLSPAAEKQLLLAALCQGITCPDVLRRKSTRAASRLESAGLQPTQLFTAAFFALC
jgi:hypothetical protein